ncbi:MAG TPA: RsmE family RNA methyltransferase [Candidatus Paceibacterota bacterium]|nr:RsmE family RNA methyltransferase [Candidatus Paceibacterota bacterium]
MRLHRFLLTEEIADRKEVIISDSDLIHQWRQVFRFTVGTQLILFDNSGFEYLGLISKLSHLGAVVRILNKEDRSTSLPEVCLFAALIKKDNFEWIIEKTTELGVSQIVPIISDRSEKKGLNMIRAKKIIKEASEQSGRVKLTRLNEPTDLEELLKSLDKGDEEKVKIFSIDPKGKPFDEKISAKIAREVGVFVGPEGGWTERELELFKRKRIPIYSLGSQILRAETAAVAIASLLLLK